MNRKLIATIATVAALTASNTIYPTTAVITDINEQNDIVTMSTASGLVYQFEGIEDYYTGDLVACLMFDNGTPDNVRDDIILSHRYTGTTKLFDETITAE